MQARTFQQGRLVAAVLAIAAAVVAVLVVGALSDPRAGSIGAPSATPSTTTSSKRSVIVQSGRSAEGRSVTAQGEPGESVTAPTQPGGAATGTARGGAGGSASAAGGSATSGSVEIQTVGP